MPSWQIGRKPVRRLWLDMSEEATTKENRNAAEEITAAQVLAYLKRHPDFLVEHPQLTQIMTAPKSELGDGVVDLQHFMVGGLQRELKTLKGTYDEIVAFCRENQSTQAQVHSAVISLIATRDLEQLLQVLTVDLVSLFDLDVVRLAMETEHADFYDTSYPDAHYSGISFIDHGTVDACLGTDQPIALCEDTEAWPPEGFDEIFSDCTALVKSCAILRLHLETMQRDVVLALGVRHKGRFHPHQGVDLLNFLARIVEQRLDYALIDIDPEAFA